MNLELKKVLDKITQKEIAALTKADIAFLRARKSYLTKKQLQQYQSVLNLTPKGTGKKDVKTP